MQAAWWTHLGQRRVSVRRGTQTRHDQHRSLSVALAVMAAIGLFAVLRSAPMAHAQAPELFTPLPTQQRRTMDAAQTKHVDRLKQRPTTASVILLQVHPEALAGDRTRMALSDAKTLDFTKSKVDTRSPTDFTWHGTLAEVPGQATLVVHEGKITGSIRDGAELYRIEPVGDGVHALIKVNPGRFPPDHPPSFKQKEGRRGMRAPQTEPPDADTRDVSLSGINVLVAYTPAARGAVADIEALVQLAVDEANQSYLNSGVRFTLTMVDRFELSYAEAGKTFDKVLADFAANPTVASRRALAGADLAVMLINKSDYCGLADAIMAKASTAFAIVYWDCATGYYSFAHELGHLQGARHDPKNDSSTTPFAHGHGYQHPSATASQAFRTIMAYRCDAPAQCEPRIQYWSNPNVTYAGLPTGTATTHDNARVLNDTASTVANFKWQLPGWYDTDRPGADYKNFDLGQANPALCQASCAGEAQCQAWTYVKPGVQGATARCWLKNSVPAMTANTCCVSGVKAVEYATDRLGGDYKSFTLGQADPALCQASCNSEASCKAWTYVKPGFQGAQARCWLKSSVPVAKANACCASGIKEAEFGVDRPGSDYKNVVLNQPDPGRCQTTCKGEAPCKAWTYVKPGVQGATARCWLKNSVPTATATACCVSGLK